MVETNQPIPTRPRNPVNLLAKDILQCNNIFMMPR